MVAHHSRWASGSVEGGAAKRLDPDTKQPDMTWRDHLVMLLHIGAELEHCLMVQYLYAAYSIGGDQIPVEWRKRVGRWRTSILSIAKEEMGHLLTVQNALTLLGAPINLMRSDFPWDLEFYPFPFSLEPFTLDSLRCYIYAEMPDPPADTPMARRLGKIHPAMFRPVPDKQADIKEIVDWVRGHYSHPHRVGELYERIIELVRDEDRIPDSVFNDATYGMQASWDDWGRGYRPSPHLLDAEGSLDTHDQPSTALGPPSDRRADVLIDRVATRTQLIKALTKLSAQGEANHMFVDVTGEPSHFDRFLEIYDEFKKYPKGVGQQPSKGVPTNPTTQAGLGGGRPSHRSVIEAKCATHFAELFNLRYRMLLTYLAHSFRLGRTHPIDQPSLRGMVMHRVFGEMYNLKAIAGVLMRLPRKDGAKDDFAGPPFQMPYSLDLPEADADIWRRHRDLLGSARNIAMKILEPDARDAQCLVDLDAGGEAYLKTLLTLDDQASVWIETILAEAS